MAFENQYMIDIRPTWVNRGQAANWEMSVRSALQTIFSVKTGQILLNSIRFWNKWVVISHYDFSQGSCNAFASELTGTARDGRQYGAVVKYSPHLFTHGGSCAASGTKDAASLPHEILFHEMTHAFRRVSGKRAWSATTGGLADYDSNEEFNAILLTNIFISDPSNKKKTPLRRDHQDDSRLGADLATSLSFFDSSRNAFDLVKQFCDDHPGLTGAVSKIAGGFNPIAAFVQNKAEAQKRSNGAKAFVNDLAGWGKVFANVFLP